MGGSAREWSAPLPADLVPGGGIDIRLVMTKFTPPAVTVAYELRLEPAG